jgi:hypothetical protein
MYCNVYVDSIVYIDCIDCTQLGSSGLIKKIVIGGGGVSNLRPPVYNAAMLTTEAVESCIRSQINHYNVLNAICP